MRYVLLVFVLCFKVYSSPQISSFFPDFVKIQKGLEFIQPDTINYDPNLEFLASRAIKLINQCGAKTDKINFLLDIVKSKTGYFGFRLIGFSGSTIDEITQKIISFFINMPIHEQYLRAGMFEKNGLILFILAKPTVFLPKINLPIIKKQIKPFFLWGKLLNDYSDPVVYLEYSDKKIKKILPELKGNLFYCFINKTGNQLKKIEITAKASKGNEVLELIDFDLATNDSCTLINKANNNKPKRNMLFNSPEMTIFKMINDFRTKSGLSALVYNPVLSTVARNHSFDMALHNFFGHISPENGSLQERLERANIVFTKGFENLAVSPSIKTAHEDLCKTPSHAEILLNPNITTVGIGVVMSGGVYFITENFLY